MVWYSRSDYSGGNVVDIAGVYHIYQTEMSATAKTWGMQIIWSDGFDKLPGSRSIAYTILFPSVISELQYPLYHQLTNKGISYHIMSYHINSASKESIESRFECNTQTVQSACRYYHPPSFLPTSK